MRISLKTVLLLHFPCHHNITITLTLISPYTVCNLSMRLAHCCQIRIHIYTPFTRVLCQNPYLIRAHSSYVTALRIKINVKKSYYILHELAFDFALMYSCHETYSLDFCMLCALHVNFYSTARVIVL